jgi:hypothetical protein
MRILIETLALSLAWCFVIAVWIVLFGLGSVAAAIANKVGVAVLAYFGIML